MSGSSPTPRTGRYRDGTYQQPSQHGPSGPAGPGGGHITTRLPYADQTPPWLAERTAPKRPRRLHLGAIAVGLLAVAAVVGVVVALQPFLSSSHVRPPAPPKTPTATGPLSLSNTLQLPGSSPMTAAAFGSQGALTAVSKNGTLTWYDEDAPGRTERVRLKTGGARLRTASARLSPSGEMVVVPTSTCGTPGSTSCTYRTFDTSTGRSGPPVPGTADQDPASDFSLGGDLMAVVDADRGSVETWNPATHSIQDGSLGRTGLESRQMDSVALDPSGAAMAISTESAGRSSILWLTDVLHPGDRSPSIVATVPTTAAAPRIALTGQTLAAGDGTATDVYRTMPSHPDRRKHAQLAGGLLALSPADGDLVATLDQDSGRVSIWDTSQMLPVTWQAGEQTGQTVPLSPTGTVTCTTGTPTAAAFSTDGRTLALGCSDGHVYLWRIGG